MCSFLLVLCFIRRSNKIVLPADDGCTGSDTITIVCMHNNKIEEKERNFPRDIYFPRHP